MGKIILMVFGLALYSFVSAQDMKGMKMPKEKKGNNQTEKVIYTCPMHPEIQLDKPGKCPKCGMTLVKKTIKISTSKKGQIRADTVHPSKDTLPAKKNMPMDMNMNMPAEKNQKTKSDTSKMNDMGNMQMPASQPEGINEKDTMKMMIPEAMEMNNMSDPFSLALPMERHGSGTGWLPDASPMNAFMFHSPKWMFMLHGNLFLRYTSQDFSNKGSRGGNKFDAPNWLMFMGQTPVGQKDLFHFSTMFSFDPITEGGSGYPLLFQSGEAYKGKPIVDRQHPHDLFSELSVSYSHAFSKNTDVFIYFGYPGEPALGPVAFMHRPAALFNPDAPLSHHWSDATHITFGVATLGVRSGKFKIDASSFTGREPDDMRYDFDKPRFDSWSGRLSFNPSKSWAFQVSHGFIKSPEVLHPDEDVNRTTASAIFSKSLKNTDLNISAVYGVNKSNGHPAENSFLLEGSLSKNKFTAYSRYEFVQKSVEELALDENIYGQNVVFPVNAFTFGVNYVVLQMGKTGLSAGTQFTFYHAGEKLNSLYGKNPMAFEVYIRLYPARMKM